MKTIIKQRLAVLMLKFRILKAKFYHQRELKKIKQKEKIKIAFLIVNQSIWKYDSLFKMFMSDSKFEPKIFICPFRTYGKEEMLKEMNGIYKMFIKKGYDVEKTLLTDGSWLDIKSNFNPDIVFFSTPWGHSLPQYGIRHFIDKLTCYVPYGFKSSNLYEYHFNLETQNLCWKFFLETKIHQDLAKKYGARKGENTVVTGAPGMDALLLKEVEKKNVWKEQEKVKKKIIWAPHHTIPGAKNALNYSTFLDYAEFMLELADKYKNEIQIAFKPHPNLRGKLNEIWGKEKTDDYFSVWELLPNGQLEQGEYIDLFYQSDAMIHDSGAFLIEYFYINKPVMFLISSEKVKDEFNAIGKEALEIVEKGYKREDIIDFIEKTIKDKDDTKEKRMTFFDEVIKPPNNKTASMNIFNHIKNELGI